VVRTKIDFRFCGLAIERNFMIGDDRLRLGARGDAQAEQFVRDGFIRIDRAFPREVAEEGCDIMWRDIPFDRHVAAALPSGGRFFFCVALTALAETEGSRCQAALPIRQGKEHGATFKPRKAVARAGLEVADLKSEISETADALLR
jgi:hypothetical protein